MSYYLKSKHLRCLRIMYSKLSKCSKGYLYTTYGTHYISLYGTHYNWNAFLCHSSKNLWRWNACYHISHHLPDNISQKSTKAWSWLLTSHFTLAFSPWKNAQECTSHFAFHTLHFAFHTLHFAFRTSKFRFNTLRSKRRISHFVFPIFHFSLDTLYMWRNVHLSISSYLHHVVHHYICL